MEKKIRKLEVYYLSEHSYEVGKETSSGVIVVKIEEVQIQTNPDFRQTYYIVSLSNGEIIEISALCATIVTYREV